MKVKMLLLAVVAGLTLTAESRQGSLDAAQRVTNVRVSGLDKGLPVSIHDTATTTATTSIAGDLELALDPTKHFVVYRRDCSRYEVVVQDSDEDKACRKEAADNPQPSGEKCGRCNLIGAIFGGKFTANSMAQSTGGSHTVRNVAIGAAAAAGIGAAFALQGSDTQTATGSTPPPLTSLSGKSFQGSVNKTSDTCGTFGNPATLRLRLVTVNADGTAVVEIVHVTANNTTFTGPGSVARQADGSFAFTAASAQNGTLVSTGLGVINSAATLASPFRTVVARADGTCSAAYDGMLPAQ